MTSVNRIQRALNVDQPTALKIMQATLFIERWDVSCKTRSYIKHFGENHRQEMIALGAINEIGSSMYVALRLL